MMGMAIETIATHTIHPEPLMAAVMGDHLETQEEAAEGHQIEEMALLVTVAKDSLVTNPVYLTMDTRCHQWDGPGYVHLVYRPLSNTIAARCTLGWFDCAGSNWIFELKSLRALNYAELT